MPNTPKKPNPYATQESQIVQIEKEIAELEETFQSGKYVSVKQDLKLFTNGTMKLVYDSKVRDALNARIKACEGKLVVLDQKRKTTQAPPVDAKKDSLTILQEAHKELVTTEEVGAGIMTNLSQQRETIFHARQNLKTVTAKTEEGSGLLTQMSKWWRD